MNKFWSLIALCAAAVAQQPTLDPNVLIDVFGQPTSESGTKQTVTQRPPTPPTQPTPATLPPTSAPVTVVTRPTVDTTGCTCVPYYLCDENLVAVYKNNASVTGWGDLDVRFGESKCQESVEKCCKTPNDPEIVTPVVTPAPLKGCGYGNPDGLDFTIKGGSGDEALFGEYPWVVVLLDNNNYVGVGVLIHPQVVLTAAHKAVNFTQPGYGRLIVRAGEWDTLTSKERLKHQNRAVQDILVHPDFNPGPLSSDLALLRLSQPVELASHINVICLPDQDESFDGSTRCVANGWGKDAFGSNGKFAVIQKKVEQNMVPYSRCQNQLRSTRLGNKFKLHETFVCAGGEVGKDTCQGDGGAPLACPISGNRFRYKLSGLVAWGISCGLKDVPGVYVAVSKFRRWIDDSMTQWGYETSGYRV